MFLNLCVGEYEEKKKNEREQRSTNMRKSAKRGTEREWESDRETNSTKQVARSLFTSSGGTMVIQTTAD